MAKKLFTTAKTEAGLNTAINDGTLDAHVVFIEESGNEGIYAKNKIYQTIPSNGREGQALFSQNGKGVWADAYTKAESDAMLATKQNVLTAGNGITIADDVISVDNKKFTVWSNPRIDEYVTTFENYGYNDNGTQKTSGSSTRSWVFKIGNYGHKKVYFSEMNAWMCDGLDDAQNMINPTLLGKEAGNVDIGAEHIGKYIVAMSVSGFAGFLGTDYGRCVLFRDEKTQAELDADERMLSDMYAGNLMRYAVATSAIADTPTLEWVANESMKKDNDRNQFLDSISRPNIGYECNVVKKLNFVYSHCGRLREIEPLWDTALVTTAKGLFQQCRALERADLSHLNLSNVTDAGYMFQCCIALKDVVLPELPSVKNCSTMFESCTSLQSIVLPELPLVTKCSYMFTYCTSLQSIVLPELPLVTDCLGMFRNCTSLKSVELQSLQSVTKCSYMFASCTSLESIVLPEMPNAKDCSCMFQNCTSLQSIVLPALPSVTNCMNMFHTCNKLEALTLNMPLCESFGCYVCYSLKDVEIIDMHSLKGLSFYGCSNVENVTCVNTLPTCKIEFSSCKLLTLDSVTNIIAHLPDLSGTDSKTITFHSDTKKIITEELIAQATNKNWIIA